MKNKIVALIIIISYLCGMYGLDGVDEWIGWISMLIPFVAVLLYVPISFIVDSLLGKGSVDEITKLYISFVFSIFGLLFCSRETDFFIGRLVMLIGGTFLYLAFYMDEMKKRDDRTRNEFYYDLKSGKKGLKDGYIL